MLDKFIPVFNGEKILIIKIVKLESAAYAGNTGGVVVCECTETDEATNIIDLLNDQA